jgi:hypothetical protein
MLDSKVQAECHYGYEPDGNDRRDMKLLQEHFNIRLVPPF